jgi:hypothetical protein
MELAHARKCTWSDFEHFLIGNQRRTFISLAPLVSFVYPHQPMHSSGSNSRCVLCTLEARLGGEVQISGQGPQVDQHGFPHEGLGRWQGLQRWNTKAANLATSLVYEACSSTMQCAKFVLSSRVRICMTSSQDWRAYCTELKRTRAAAHEFVLQHQRSQSQAAAYPTGDAMIAS